MALFGKKRNAVKAAEVALQPPDELCQKAKLANGSQQFASAAEYYSEAIDKLHTMYVMGDCSYRSPSANDTKILQGFVSAVGATKASGQSMPTNVTSAIAYLSQIAETAAQRNADPAPYNSAARDAEFELRT